ncbi:hypothetical protein KAR28_07100 [Candidatus Parcubacteria bacterium]|nr:hypothetical protein [Candidatus Parcubacteria bacterium]
MIKLKYSIKRTITTADLYDATDPPLVFEVLVRPPRAWAVLHNQFEDGGSSDAELAKELISLAFLTVSDEENTYPLDTIEAANELEAAIEVENPGCGKDFSCNIAWAFGRHHYSFLGDHLGNSLEPLPQSNGSSGEKSPVKAS